MTFKGLKRGVFVDQGGLAAVGQGGDPGAHGGNREDAADGAGGDGLVQFILIIDFQTQLHRGSQKEIGGVLGMVAEGSVIDLVEGKEGNNVPVVPAAKQLIKYLNPGLRLEEGQDRGGVKDEGPDLPAPGPGGAAPAGPPPKVLRAWQCLSVSRTGSPGWDRPRCAPLPLPSRAWSAR